MDIIRTDRLSARQTDAIKELLNECRDLNGQTPFFPFEDGDLFYLLFTETNDEADDETVRKIQKEGSALSPRKLVCAAALSFFEDSDAPYAECSAFTRPDFRQKGYFSFLFDELSQDIEEVDLYFPVNVLNEGTAAALEALGAVHDRDEYRMELDLEHIQALPDVSFQASSASEVCKDPASCLCARWEKLGNNSFLLSFCQSNRAVGTCCLSFFEDSVCFYSFEIEEGLRGRGLGRKALSLTLSLLKSGIPLPGCERIFLHVSGLNTPATALYRKAGFRIKESLSYYLY